MSSAEGRRFGLTVGAAFLVLGGALAWRGRAVAPVALALGALLLAAGVIVPTRLGPITRAWASFGSAISKITTPIFLGIVYYAAITPIGLLLRAFGRNPLTRHRSGPSCWVARPVSARSRRDMQRQF